MSEPERQEGQKTVVAFITGLLIGGLLVWVFSSTPEDKVPADGTSGDSTEQADANASQGVKKSDVPSKDGVIAADKGGEPVAREVVTGDGVLTVSDQKAGMAVELGKTVYPHEDGWIAVRDYMDGVPGNILGAARYSVKEGLSPASVELLRSTMSGNEYQVVFYTEDGDMEFNLRGDRLVEGVSATFTVN